MIHWVKVNLCSQNKLLKYYFSDKNNKKKKTIFTDKECTENLPLYSNKRQMAFKSFGSTMVHYYLIVCYIAFPNVKCQKASLFVIFSR